MSDDIKLLVRSAYAEVAKQTDASCCAVPNSSGSCANGYSEEELAALPEGADLGVGCGNPLALASAQPGQVVLDLGSGAGIDCFLAAKAVGPAGRVIGVDMTPEMVARARRNAENAGYANVEFRLGEIEALPVADATVDLAISNCVINLVPDQSRVFAEAFRVLKPGGRLIISDTLQTHPLPDAVLNTPAAKMACLSAAITPDDYLASVVRAGFRGAAIVKATPYPQEMAFEESLEKKLIEDFGLSMEDIKAAANSMMSITVEAVKPA
ncbi:MAG: arsenite methyltransferase [Dehalococcoidia bacterium]